MIVITVRFKDGRFEPRPLQMERHGASLLTDPKIPWVSGVKFYPEISGVIFAPTYIYILIFGPTWRIIPGLVL